MSAKCHHCGKSDEWVVGDSCDECHEKAHGIDAVEYDSLTAAPGHRDEVDECVEEFGHRGVISDPIECAIASLREYCYALEDAIRYRDAIHGAPPPWRPIEPNGVHAGTGERDES